MTKLALTPTMIIALLLIGGCDYSPGRPKQTAMIYAVNRCGGPAPGWSRPGSDYGELMTRNKLAVEPAGLTWNGVLISAATLRPYLQAVRKLTPRVNLQVVFDEHATCSLVRPVRTLVADKLDCSIEGACVEYSVPDYEREALRHIVY